jgi:hypothetical protein
MDKIVENLKKQLETSKATKQEDGIEISSSKRISIRFMFI